MPEDTYRIAVELDTSNVQTELMKLRRQTIQQMQTTVGPVTAAMMTGMPLMPGYGMAPGLSAATLGGFGVQFGPSAMDYAARVMLPFQASPAAKFMYTMGISPFSYLGTLTQFSEAQRVVYEARERIREQLTIPFGQLSWRERIGWAAINVFPWVNTSGMLFGIGSALMGWTQIPTIVPGNMFLRLLGFQQEGLMGIIGGMLLWSKLSKLGALVPAAGTVLPVAGAIAGGIGIGAILAGPVARTIFATPEEWGFFVRSWMPTYVRRVSELARRYGISSREMMGRIEAIEELYRNPDILQRWAQAASWLWNPQGIVPFGMDVQSVAEIYQNFIGYVKSSQFYGSSQLITDVLRRVNMEARVRRTVQRNLLREVPAAMVPGIMQGLTIRTTPQGIRMYQPLFREYAWYERLATRAGLFATGMLRGWYEYLAAPFLETIWTPLMGAEEAQRQIDFGRQVYNRLYYRLRSRELVQKYVERINKVTHALENVLIERSPELMEALIRTGEILPWYGPESASAVMRQLALSMGEVAVRYNLPPEVVTREAILVGTRLGIQPTAWFNIIRPGLQRFAPFGVGPERAMPLVQMILSMGRNIGYYPQVVTAQEASPLIQMNNAILGRVLGAAYRGERLYRDVFVNMGGPVQAAMTAFRTGAQIVMQSPLAFVAALAAEVGKTPAGGFTNVFDLFGAAGQIFNEGGMLDMLFKIKTAPKKTLMQSYRFFSALKTHTNLMLKALGVNISDPKARFQGAVKLFQIFNGLDPTGARIMAYMTYGSSSPIFELLNQRRQEMENLLSQGKLPADIANKIQQSGLLLTAAELKQGLTEQTIEVAAKRMERFGRELEAALPETMAPELRHALTRELINITALPKDQSIKEVDRLVKTYRLDEQTAQHIKRIVAKYEKYEVTPLKEPEEMIAELKKAEVEKKSEKEWLAQIDNSIKEIKQLLEIAMNTKTSLNW